MECPFCNVANINLRKFYENELFLAVYNLRPLVSGHCLVMPKRHVKSLLELNESEKRGLLSFLDRVIFIALKYADAYQFDLICQEGVSAGQSLDHTHFHVIPRKTDDGIAVAKKEWLEEFNKSERDVRKNLNTEETERIVKRLKLIVREHRIQIEAL